MCYVLSFEMHTLIGDWYDDYTNFHRYLSELFLGPLVIRIKYEKQIKNVFFSAFGKLAYAKKIKRIEWKKLPCVCLGCVGGYNMCMRTWMNVFFMSCPGILKPDLCDTFTQPRYRCNTLQILSIRITIDLKIGLKYL